MGDRLRVRCEVDDDVVFVHVPPFSLQTLVESGIRHGLQPLPDGGDLEVRVGRAPGGVVPTVVNDAAGGAVTEGHGQGLANPGRDSRRSTEIGPP